MQLDMDDVHLHDVVIDGKEYQIRTGRLPNGFWRKCPGFECGGVEISREAALRDACAEIKARAY